MKSTHSQSIRKRFAPDFWSMRLRKRARRSMRGNFRISTKAASAEVEEANAKSSNGNIDSRSMINHLWPGWWAQASTHPRVTAGTPEQGAVHKTTEEIRCGECATHVRR